MLHHRARNSIDNVLFPTRLLLCFLVCAGPIAARADSKTPAENSATQRPDDAEKPPRIQDNSFLLEEAYNQETGVIQHIQAFQRMRNNTWSYSFTEEWPAPNQKHQLSCTIPFLRPDESSDDNGIGDVLLNYRYQAVFKDHVAFAPRLSLVLPTGDEKKGTGSGAFGVQTNLPLSIELSEKLVTHWNAGLTLIPDAKGPGGVEADTVGYNLGASAIWNVAENVDLMLESLWTSNESVEAVESPRQPGRLSNESVVVGSSTKRSDAFFISPGFRFAINCKSGLQIVPGLAVPIGVGPSKDDVGVFFYLSFEHPLKKTAKP